MYIGYTDEQAKLRSDLRAYYDELLTPDVVADLAQAHGVGPVVRRIVRQMGEDGWLGIGWPVEYGGQGRSAIEQFIFFDESMRAGAPVPMLTINTVGPTIMNFGTDEQKAFFLPKILKGEIHFCIGYSEPGAGTDLAALTTRAVRDGDEYVINGQKMWTSLASDADYIWLATRTNPEVKKHKGISLFVIDMKNTPGIKIEPLRLLGDHDINATFFEDVRVPAANLVGGEDNGWTLITNQLNHERVTLCSSGIIERCLEETRAWAQATTMDDGRRVIDQEWVQINLARVRAKLEFLRLMNWKVAWTATQGRLDVADASTTKVFGTEFYLEAFRLLMEIIGEPAYLTRDSADATLKGRLEMSYRSLLILTFGGGTNEIQRDLIAMFGLGLPREQVSGVDFDLTEAQQAVHDLAGQIFAGRLTPERRKAVDADADHVDRDLWRELAKSGLLGVSLPTAYGGGDQDFLATALLLEQAGRHAAPVPALTLVLGALTIAQFGSADQQAALLPGIADGSLIVTAALASPPGVPGVTASEVEGAWRLDGTRTCVPAGSIADRVIVPTDAGVFIADPGAPGVVVTRLVTTTGSPEAHLDFGGAPAEWLGDASIADWMSVRATAAVCSILAGVCKQAVSLTAEYAKTRQQFDRPIATFQAVAQRVADASIDAEGVHLTARQAAWRLSAGLPAEEEVAIAKFWAADAGQRVVHAAQHVHGGMGVDRDYPVHRYFLLAKQLELTLGGATNQLRKLGAVLAATPASS